MQSLDLQNLHVTVDGTEIIKGMNLVIPQGEVHALMGPNGSGKSTLANALMGHPRYKITKGSVTFDGQDVLSLAPHERAKLGLFLSFQYPVEVSGVSIQNFLRTAYNSLHGTKERPVNVGEFLKRLKEKMRLLGMDESFIKRSLNEGFSGGEKKRMEIVQLAVLEPKIAILDETDSGLDVDALKMVARGVNTLRGPNVGMLIITHYSRVLQHIEPDVVHVMVNGKLVKSSGKELAHQIEERGYEAALQPV